MPDEAPVTRAMDPLIFMGVPFSEVGDERTYGGGRRVGKGACSGGYRYDGHHIEERTRADAGFKWRQFWVRARCLSAALRSASASLGSSTARVSTSAPTIVATVTRARSCAPGCPQSGDWRATRSIICLMRRVAARLTSGVWRGISEPSAAVAQPVSTPSTCAFER